MLALFPDAYVRHEEMSFKAATIPNASDLSWTMHPPFGVLNSLLYLKRYNTLQWRHNGHDIVSNHQPHDCLFNRLFRRRSKKTSKLHVTGLCMGNSPGTGEFLAQMASNAENGSIWWRHHERAMRYITVWASLVLPSYPCFKWGYWLAILLHQT